MAEIIEDLAIGIVRIDNDFGGGGTGFLVGRMAGQGEMQVFVVTNKHVLWSDQTDRELVENIVLHFNERTKEGVIVGHRIKRLLSNSDGSPAWREHPDEDVDVCAIEATGLATSGLGIRLIGYGIFVNTEKQNRHEITMGDDVIVIGYPSSGIEHAGNNFPLVRQGIIASRLGVPLEDEIMGTTGRARRRLLRGFLVDGAIIPGSSGSPVFIKPVSQRLEKGGLAIYDGPVLIFLGIIAETRLTTVKGDVFEGLTYAGLGLAFDAETVRETIELFYQ